MAVRADKSKVKEMVDIFFGQGEFVPPPEAPVFEPTWDEFKDPAAYIEKIRAVGEKAGICRIRPPPSWQPPFAIDIETFRFTPRLQKLNELEARSRMKMNFVDRLLKFWNLQGMAVKVPIVEKQPLDLFKLHKAVSEEGGFEYVCNERKWSKVAERMGYNQVTKNVGPPLRQHYERILYPFDLFNVGASVPGPKTKPVVQKISPLKQEEENKPLAANTEPASKKRGKQQKQAAAEKTADQYFCEVCEGGDNDELMLLCDGCDDAYHTYCLRPALADIPPGDWRCPRCISEECAKPPAAYGFEEAPSTYSLYSFGTKCDQFKAEYFKTSGKLVPTSVVEKEFWRLVNCHDEDVIVEYGADIHALEHGSGFPTEATRSRFPGYEEYIKCGWNLNNLPVLRTSVLRFIDAHISGMKVPWLYVGMCFSCFCWHTEDHWSYSISYNHWGEPKTWYGVPGASALLFEECMQKTVGELFEHAPDLLHQMTTIINPNILMAYGVPVVRTDQHAGEFVITFPRSYHAGFNQGYNCAEAVNYCPADWLPLGRGCIEHYRSVSRQDVFSHDELLCLIASDPSDIDIDLAVIVADDLTNVFEREKKLRIELLSQGINEMKKVEFEKLTDDERECCRCQSTLFLSAIECQCKPKSLRCVDHTTVPCECKPTTWKLLYRHTADELDALLVALKQRAECLPQWTKRVNEVLNADSDNRRDWKELKALATEASKSKIPAPADLLRKLNNTVHEAEECVLVAKKFSRCLASNGDKAANGQSGKLSLDEIKTFCLRVDAAPCQIPEADEIKDLLREIEACQMEAKEALTGERLPTATKLKQLMDRGTQLCVEVLEAKPLKWLWEQASWLEDVEHSINDRTRTTLDALCRLIDGGTKLEKVCSGAAVGRETRRSSQGPAGGGSPSKQAIHPSVSVALGRLKSQLAAAEGVQKRATALMEPSCRPDVASVKSVLADCDALAVHLPCADKLRVLLQTVTKWSTAVESALRKDHGLHVPELERFVHDGSQVPLTLNLLQQLETKKTNIKQWKDRVASMFGIRSQADSFLQVLFPLVDRTILAKELKSQKLDGISDIDYAGCCNENALNEVLRTLERQSTEAMSRKRNEQKSELNSTAEASLAFVKSHDDSESQQVCLLCRSNFTVDAVSLLTAVSSHMDTKFFCQSCRLCWPQRARFVAVAELVDTYKSLRMCLPAGKVLSWLAERAGEWKKAAKKELESEKLAPFTAGVTPSSPRAGIPDAVQVPEERQRRLEELLVEGMLLGIELEETGTICQLLLACRQHEQQMNVEEVKVESPKATGGEKRKTAPKRKPSGDDISDEGPSAKTTPTKARQAKEKKAAVVAVATPGSAKKPAAEPKKRRGSKSGGKKSAGKKSSSDTSDDDNGKYDTCSAKKCLKPTGKKIDWVQCDGCELWFHLCCVGLTPDQVSDDEDEQYHCNDCIRLRSASNSAASALPVAVQAARSPASPPLPATSKSASNPQPSRLVPTATKDALKPAVSVASAVKVVKNQSPAVGLPSTIFGGNIGFTGSSRPGGSGLRLSDCIEPMPGSASRAGSGPAAEVAGRSLGGSKSPSYAFGQFLYTPWLSNSSLTPR